LTIRRTLLTIAVVATAIALGVLVAHLHQQPDAAKDLWSSMQRFPRPALPADYVAPTTDFPAGRANVLEYIDTAVLVAALAGAAYLALKRRSRAGIFVLMILSLAYFGFYRGGCVCPIGAIQHVASALFANGVISVVVVLFFVLPLVAALFFGRIFCSSVCPLGAIQDAMLLRPLKVPTWLEHGLELFAYVYLGLAVLFATTGAGYIICRYDPFVALFRLSGDLNMLLLGASFILISMFVGRAYCRYLCPYGVLLKLLSRLSWRRATITPDECVQCRLCEDACPFGAIQKPTPPPDTEARTEGKAALGLLVVAFPVLCVLGAWLGYLSSDWLAGAHPAVSQARTVRAEMAKLTGPEEQLELKTQAFLRTAKTPEQLYEEERAAIDSFKTGGIFFGLWLGIVAGAKLVGLSVRRKRTDYEAEPGRCVACGRCFLHCPREHLRRKALRETADNT